jgi:serine/threonine-protein kinase
MAFALLTGNLPFHRQETMATLFAHLNDPVPPLSRYRGGLRPGTDAVLARALAKEARDRYAGCGEFAAALRGALAGASHSAPGAGPAGQPGAAQTRLESAPRASRPPHVPETAVWPDTRPPVPETAVWPDTRVWPDAPGGAQPATEVASASPFAPSGGAASPLAPSWPWSAPDAATPATPAARGGRPATSLPPPPPPAAGQGGKLPLISKSAVIAALAAAAVLLILYLLHGGG